MARSELGTKRTCPVTGRKFYDLNKDPIVSPYTGQIVPIAAAIGAVAGRASRATAADTRADEGEELIDQEAGDVELVSLEDADGEDAPAKKVSNSDDDDVDGEDEDIGGDDDATFIEDDEDSDDDVSDLIDGDISDDEEA